MAAQSFQKMGMRAADDMLPHAGFPQCQNGIKAECFGAAARATRYDMNDFHRYMSGRVT